MDFIDLKRQYRAYQSEIDAAMAAVLAHGQFIMGPEVAELERRLATFVGIEHAIGVASGTDALSIVLMALGIGAGDEVITVPYTFIATAEAPAHLGARPVFVDIEPRTYCMDPAKLEAAITPKTRAIVPVSLYGQMPDLEAIEAIASRHGIVVIEDAAQSFGATRRGVRSCGVTRVSCTSFFPAKPFGCYGDGGAIFTSDAAIAAAARSIRVHGSTQRHHHPRLGLTSRLDTIQAAALLAKLPHFESEVAARARLGGRYDALLAGACRTPAIAQGNSHVYAQYAVLTPERDRVAAEMQAAGVPTAIHYPVCLHQQPALAHLGYRTGDFPVAEAVARDVLCLPMHPFLTDVEQDRIVAALRAAARAPAATAHVA
ncbi:MAG TPA: DegT/DnrJ/EryC1/StrS family aminotransferase [Planctomycetota bacterium]|nr:DegT/DnrJ/EryC1/StrS family aminotransferase [Planctomycetota bacterium]